MDGNDLESQKTFKLKLRRVKEYVQKNGMPNNSRPTDVNQSSVVGAYRKEC